MHVNRATAAGVFLLAVLSTPLTGSAAPVSGTTAKFTMSISGTFTSSGRATVSCADANDNQIVVQRAASTTWTFTTTKAGRGEFAYYKPNFLAGMTKLITVAATGARTASESPTCGPSDLPDGPIGMSCGTKTARYLMSIYAAGPPGRIGYGINLNMAHLEWPDDPWGLVDRTCPALAAVWTSLTVYSAPPTPISPAKVFNKRVSRIVANGTRTGHGPPDSDASSTWTLRYKVTLTRRH
jgi:hypothetical protein